MPVVTMRVKVGNRVLVSCEGVLVCDWPGCSSAHRIGTDETIAEAMAEAMHYDDGDAWRGLGKKTKRGRFQYYLCSDHASVMIDELENAIKNLDEMSNEEIEDWIEEGVWTIDGFTENAFLVSRPKLDKLTTSKETTP